jgi:hypothetical protein
MQTRQYSNRVRIFKRRTVIGRTSTTTKTLIKVTIAIRVEKSIRSISRESNSILVIFVEFISTASP